MSNFKATNNFKLTKFAFYERLRFKLDAYSRVNHTNLKDIDFSSLNQYGRIDERYDSVYLDPAHIRRTVNNKNAINFVCDAFDSVVEHFRRANNFERISPNETFLTDLKCHTGYIDPLEQYSNYIDEILELYNFNYVKFNMVKSFKDYLSFFIPYAKFLKSEFPMTFSGWLRSKRCSPFVTGLYLNVSNSNLGDDTAKERDFLRSKNFDFYLNTCKSRGFYVAKSNPSILIADIKSTPMKEFMARYDSAADMFESNYLLAYKKDIELLKLKLIQHYNIFTSNRQVIIKQKISRDNKVYSKIELINNNNINYINNIIYKLYINIRNIEEDYVYGDSDINQFIKKAKKYEKSFDKDKAIDYINIKFRSTYASKYGGLNYYNEKFTKMED